jgi:hypothetical protein
VHDDRYCRLQERNNMTVGSRVFLASNSH